MLRSFQVHCFYRLHMHICIIASFPSTPRPASTRILVLINVNLICAVGPVELYILLVLLRRCTVGMPYPRMPFMEPSEASFSLAIISSYLAGLPSRQVKSTTDTSVVGTRKAMPVSLPFRAGSTCRLKPSIL